MRGLRSRGQPSMQLTRQSGPRAKSRLLLTTPWSMLHSAYYTGCRNWLQTYSMGCLFADGLSTWNLWTTGWWHHPPYAFRAGVSVHLATRARGGRVDDPM